MHNKIAVVTGAARGLGRAIAEAFAREGAAVAVTDLNREAAAAVAESLTGMGAAGARAWSLDVRDAAGVEAVFTEIDTALGTPDLLVNNAGVYPDNPLIDMAEAAWDAVIDTNLKGPLLCGQSFVRRRIAAGGGGSIVNVASTAAFSARAGAGHYCASKAGLVMLTKCMAMEFGPHRIRVNAVAPGLIEVEGERVSADYKRNFLPMIPYGRIGQPEDVARAVTFLASDQAEFITGAVLTVDGGFLTGRPLMRSASV
ncbi:SDR family NAD(P)-dependent oxidoreductase [Elioraea sp.]|uniref:SDR family NAD(P)-dependent oxidoreductase n=1 Tax=Elioraea sp. TaxID=2185103 RepID=UPI0025BBF238|nr:glucose 1-dehydrogenase [Elioraea sp.]